MTHQTHVTDAPEPISGQPLPPCRHCPDCSRPPEHLVQSADGDRGYCSPCLVALDDLFGAFSAEDLPLDVGLCRVVRQMVLPLADVDWNRAERGTGRTLEQLRAMHAYNWTETPPEPGPSARGLAPQAYRSLTEFYRARGGCWSGEADFGVHHTAAGVGIHGPCRWRVSVVASTGDAYATSPCSCEDHPRVLLLGSTRPDALYHDADRRFDGWAFSGSRDLTWFRARAAVPYSVVSPPVTLIRDGDGERSAAASA